MTPSDKAKEYLYKYGLHTSKMIVKEIIIALPLSDGFYEDVLIELQKHDYKLNEDAT